MIRKFIDRLLGKTPAPARELPAGVVLGKRVEIPVEVHGIDPKLLADPAVRIVKTLQSEGYEAYIVGGAVRDLLLGLRPKDFDVATNATPEQVKSLFRRAYIVGRRFRIVHVIHGRGREHEQIEVSTFRAYVDVSEAAQVEGNEKTSKEDLAGKSHAVDASGRVLRDNVWGPQNEDAARRDFTVNAMYYDPQTQVVVDYHGGFQDSKAKLLRMIGDPELRYREDPVRIIRVLRFAAKLDFAIEVRTEAPIRSMKALLANVPSSRMFDEMIKLLQTGHSLQSLEVLKKYGLDRGVFPILDAHFEGIANDAKRDEFVRSALADTDRRVAEGKPVAPSFLMACMFWHEVSNRWKAIRDTGEEYAPALQQAIDATFEARIGDISGRGKLAADMREIWLMQPRFARRTGNAPEALLKQPRFRAAFDFMRLRADAGEADRELAEWWERYSSASEGQREEQLEDLRKSSMTKRSEKAAGRAAGAGRKGAAGKAGGAAGAGAGGAGGDNKIELLKQLTVTTRAALADDATDDDKTAARAMFDKLGLHAGGTPAEPGNARQEMLQEFCELTLVAIAPGGGATDRAIARGMLEKLEKRASSGNRRRRGGKGKPAEGAAAKPAAKDDDEEVGEDFFGF